MLLLSLGLLIVAFDAIPIVFEEFLLLFFTLLQENISASLWIHPLSSNKQQEHMIIYIIELSQKMSSEPGRYRPDNDSMSENDSNSEEHDFISISKKYNEKTIRQAEVHKRMDMIYNFMVKNDVKVEKKTDVKEEKVRKTRKDKEGRKFICGCPGKPGYLSYPALYTHIKTKHNGVAPEGTIRGESGKPKKRGRPKVRKAPQIYEREIEKNQFPKELSNLVQRQSLQILEQFQDIELAEDEEVQGLSLKYFVNLLRDLKRVQNTRIYLLPISQVITVFLENLKEFIAENVLYDFEQTFLELIKYANRKHEAILKDYQLVSRYYIDGGNLKEGESYCEVQRPSYLPVIVQRFMRSQLSADDELEQGLLVDFCRWMLGQQLTEIRLRKDSNNVFLNQ